MSEAQWLACTHPTLMVEFLRANGKVSDRKLRLFAVACCRRIWHLLTDKRSQQAVEVAERFADWEATGEELVTAYYQSNVACNLADPTDLATLRASQLASNVAYAAVLHGVYCTPLAAAAIADCVADVDINGRAYRIAYQAELAAQCKLLVDILGRFPFRPITLGPAWPHPSKHIAAVIYQERTFDRLPVLADALQESGCTTADILDHCRQPGPHVRGCWVVDLLLGKE